jgi:hypothetical protein
MARTIKLTEAEFNAVMAAANLYQAEAVDFAPGDPGYAEHRRAEKALDRVIEKWYEAGRR